MHKHLAVIAVFFVILSNSEATPGQNITSATPRGDAMLEANDSGTSNKLEDEKIVSPQASAEAKRLYKEAVKYGRGGLSIQASQLYEKAVQLNPNYAAAYYGLGQAYFDQRRWEEAILSFEKAVKINPKDKKTRANLDEARMLASKNTEPAQHSGEETTAANPSPDIWAESRPRNVKAASAPVSLNVPPNPIPNKSKPESTSADLEAASAPAVEKPASTPAVEEPASTPAVEKPASTPAVEKPASTPAVEKPASTPAVEKPASTPAVEKPASTPAVEKPASTPAVDVRLGNEPATQSTLFTGQRAGYSIDFIHRHSNWTT